MEKLTVYDASKGNTLSVWFDDPKKARLARKPATT